MSIVLQELKIRFMLGICHGMTLGSSIKLEHGLENQQMFPSACF